MTMRRTRHTLLTTTAALSVAIGTIAPLPVLAQPAQTPPAATPNAATPPEAGPEATTPPEETPAEDATAPEEDAPDEDMAEPETPAEDAPAADRAPDATTEATPPEAAMDAPQAASDAAPEASEAPETAPAPATDAPETSETTEPAPAPEPEAPADDAPATAPMSNEAAEPEATPEAEPEAAPAAQGDAPKAEPAPTASTTATEAPADAQPSEQQPSEQAEGVLDAILGGAGLGGVAAGAAATDAPDSAATEETTTEITEENARSSSEDFATTASGETRSENRDRGGLSDLQKAGLLALGGLTVGALLGNGNEVVSNTGDRVVVRQNDGNYTVLKDDDALLRQPGSTVRTENFTDGSTRSTVEYTDGSRVVTVRDASGRVLRRERIDPVGQQVRLFDDTAQVAPVDTSVLPQARDDVRVAASDRSGLQAALDRIAARENARAYSLSQVRDYRQVRALAPVVDVNNITFRSGSAAIDVSQAEQLSELGNLMRDMIADRPGEVFLIEGHTDAIGSAASNLALSDRRAESVALALTEYFDVPPANMVVQGYGESDLRVDTQQDEPRNRRVAVRIITPLLQTAQAR
ncbi:OmpA family protein [Falsirhodobacter halotolerans]|uniref:OmpA family protein n=1 Tax=Falsirhodobacter halotolerans TaxID=1146892 RepID=UPI001FD1B18A|nr:OmpA family protein [Falsirhodobacter halotolerans]MCJ8141186.1 OmpA family protein [Falsirhodobacter halotolerans]